MVSKVKFVAGCAYFCTLLCTIIASPALADICFLPTGACEEGSVGKTATQKTCEEYVNGGGYYTTQQDNMNCTIANIPGCTLYECSVKSCESQGFHLGPTNLRTEWPMGRSSADWNCEYCKEGTKYKWKCSPLDCPDNYKTKSECAETETWKLPEGVPVPHKSGRDACGICVPNSEITCSEGLVDSIPSGCVTCDYVNSTGEGGRACYKCEAMDSYEPENTYLATHDSSCYKSMTMRAADGGLCYKGIKIDCPNDQYLSEENRDGKVVCACRDYEYKLETNPSMFMFPASGGTAELSVSSYRIGNEIEPWEYNISASSGICTFNKSGDKVAIACSPNMSTEPVSLSLTLVQANANGIDSNVKTVGVYIEKDSCPAGLGSLTNNCTGGTLGVQSGTSVAGQPCYICQNDSCPAGYTEGEPPADTGYDVVVVESGKKCHKAIEVPPEPDTCPACYEETVPTCSSGFKTAETTRSDGVKCYKCVSEECPVGKDCTDDPVCPNGKPCPGKVDCSEIAVGDTTKYYDCKCKSSAISCDDGYEVDEENCGCQSKQCPSGYDENITSCEIGWKLDTPNGKAGGKDCNRCIEETCPGSVCKPFIYCLNNTNEDCTPNPNIECDETQLGADKVYYNCTCKLKASDCKEGYDFDSNRCECRAEDCPVGYKTETTGCPSDGYDYTTSGKSGDVACGKCTAKTCPAGQTCTTDPVCPNGQSCPNNPDVKCDKIMLGEETKYTNCRCNLSGTKDGYTLDSGNCKWVANECPAGTATSLPQSVCPTGDNGGYHVTELTTKAGNETCKRCDANTCPSGKSCTPSPINPGNGSDATGNEFVSCTKIKLGANWAYYDCSCNVSDAKCGSGKKANTTACTCERCDGKLQSELSGPMTCEKITCGGQTRYKNCASWGSQWQITSNSKCNTPAVSDDGRTYYDTSVICQCKRGTTSSNCGNSCQSTQKCMPGDTRTMDDAPCYYCKDDVCPSGKVKNPSDCNSSAASGSGMNIGSAKASGTTEAGSTCYECVSTCTPSSCSGYTYSESEFIKSSTTYYEECDPGCGAAKKYKCKGNSTPTVQDNGRTVCVPNGSGGTTGSKTDCDKSFPSSSGWEYLGADQKGSQAATEYMNKYKWPTYKYEIKNCSGTSHMYGRHYSTVCQVYNYCSNASTNMQCYQTNQVFNMESLGYCCDKKGSQTQVNGYYGTITTTDEYCCYAGENCPVSRVTTGAATDDATKKCGSKAYVPKDQMSKYTKACGDSRMVPNCSSPSSDADYVCCTCTQRPS